MLSIAVLTLLLSHAAYLGTEEIWTSCLIRGHREGPGNLTCQFGVNLNVSRNAFVVQRYGLDFRNTEPDDVLLGAWHTRDQVEYYVRDGYAFDGQVTNTIVVKMSSITADYEGRYRCQVIPNDEELVDECMLIISDLYPPLPPSSSTGSMVRTTKVSVDQEEQASSSPGMTVGAVVRELSIAALTAVVTRLR